MKIRLFALLVLVFLLTNVMGAGAQPAHACGTIFNLSVTYDRDAAGFFPKLSSGDQNQFNCITGRDPSFNSQRFDAPYQAANYWFGLLGQELGATMIQLPPPSTP